jgi:hypothetical protein
LGDVALAFGGRDIKKIRGNATTAPTIGKTVRIWNCQALNTLSVAVIVATCRLTSQTYSIDRSRTSGAGRSVDVDVVSSNRNAAATHSSSGKHILI